MGNTFGKYDSQAQAEFDLRMRGFESKVDDLGERFVKMSTNGMDGRPQMAIVKIIEQTVDPKYGQPNYFQHEYI